MSFDIKRRDCDDWVLVSSYLRLRDAQIHWDDVSDDDGCEYKLVRVHRDSTETVIDRYPR